MREKGRDGRLWPGGGAELSTGSAAVRLPSCGAVTALARCRREVEAANTLHGLGGWRCVRARGGHGDHGWAMAVYSFGDVVSDRLAASGQWEDPTLIRLAEQRLRSEALSNASSDPLLTTGKLMVDVGAHIGWQTLLAAHSGWRVLAVEAMPRNAALLNLSLCLADAAVQRRVRLVNSAVGDPSGGPCEAVAPPDNVGDGHLFCGPDAAERVRQAADFFLAEGHRRGAVAAVRIARFDDILDEYWGGRPGRAHLLKIDVEGAELLAMRTAERALSRGAFRLLESEVWKQARGGGAAAYARFLQRHGFSLAAGHLADGGWERSPNRIRNPEAWEASLGRWPDAIYYIYGWLRPTAAAPARSPAR
eukprot:TRINITY_DN30247_c0_g1_i2.p1 TRINITY_DN30247_c0_g1~~TRINITY_DN30247_c0_g1_i2.p1  ORF type:complete len:363 (+),score=76.06 TRINITY_DN30247_c0_g1_i2:72-1160(+)